MPYYHIVLSVAENSVRGYPLEGVQLSVPKGYTGEHSQPTRLFSNTYTPTEPS